MLTSSHHISYPHIHIPQAAANASGNAFSIEYERGACLGATPLCDCPVLPDPNAPLCGITNTSRISAATEVDITPNPPPSHPRRLFWFYSREDTLKEVVLLRHGVMSHTDES